MDQKSNLKKKIKTKRAKEIIKTRERLKRIIAAIEKESLKSKKRRELAIARAAKKLNLKTKSSTK